MTCVEASTAGGREAGKRTLDVHRLAYPQADNRAKAVSLEGGAGYVVCAAAFALAREVDKADQGGVEPGAFVGQVAEEHAYVHVVQPQAARTESPLKRQISHRTFVSPGHTGAAYCPPT